MPPSDAASFVAIVDSGVGGLSIFQAIKAKRPDLSLLYCSDNANFPYGPKDADTVTQCLDGVIGRLLAHYPIELVVIACNTASTVALPTLRERHAVPFVGVVPAIKTAANLSATKVIGLLATPGTVARPYTDELIAEHATDCEVVKVGSTRLVELAEEKLQGQSVDKEELVSIVTPIAGRPDCDTVVLGCTHFPLLQDELAGVLPRVAFVDSGEAIARRVDDLVETQKVTAEYRALVTDMGKCPQEMQRAMQGFGLATLSQF